MKVYKFEEICSSTSDLFKGSLGLQMYIGHFNFSYHPHLLRLQPGELVTFLMNNLEYSGYVSEGGGYLFNIQLI